jgi:ribonuclease T2
MRRLMKVSALLIAVLAPGVAAAQGPVCSPPATLQPPHPELPSATEPSRVLPIGGYTLAITWSPQFCRNHGGEPANAFECAGPGRFGFTLHGLWPDGVGAVWPQYCKATPILPPALIGKTLCSTPSEQLIQHEWAKHGTCMAGSPSDYFGKSTRLYRALRYPDMAALSREPLTVGRLKAAFAAANPAIPADAVRVTLNRDQWLDEIWLCLDLHLRYARCRPQSGGAPDAATVQIWRGAR